MDPRRINSHALMRELSRSYITDMLAGEYGAQESICYIYASHLVGVALYLYYPREKNECIFGSELEYISNHQVSANNLKIFYFLTY